MASTDSQLFPLEFEPGFHRESTKYAESGKWFDGNRVRFRDGKPENIRGYSNFSNHLVSGFARDLVTWTDNNTRKYQAYGTNTQLYVTQNEEQYDVTPVTTVVSVANNFKTFLNSTDVRVSVTNHGVSATDRIIFSGVDTFSGTSVNGIKVVTSVSGVNRFYITANASANANADNVGGTNGTIKFLLGNEESNNIQGLGYGAGVYNAGVSIPEPTDVRAWNEAALESNIVFLGAQWKLDTWGEDLIALRRGGRINFLDIDTSTTPVRAIPVTAAPFANTFIISPNDRHVVCYGAVPFGDSEISPMTVRWADQNDYTEWTPSTTNTSGEVILTEGSQLVGAIRSRNTINVWSDKAMYTQTFVGSPFIFRFTQVGSNCGLIGPHAAVDIDGVSYWMGDNNFYSYDGRVRTMDCTVRRFLFNNFNMTQKEKVYAGINSEFKEIIWLYPLAGSEEPNGYVIYNYEEDTWVYGKLFEEGIVTVFQDRNVFDNTITIGRVSVTDDMRVFNNEPNNIYTGNIDGINKSLTSFIESAEFDLDEGKKLMFIDKIIPDYTFTSGESIGLHIKTREYPSADVKEKGPYTVDDNTQKINLRARGRQSVIKVSSTDTGSWRWGSVRMSMKPDGER